MATEKQAYFKPNSVMLSPINQNLQFTYIRYAKLYALILFKLASSLKLWFYFADIRTKFSNLAKDRITYWFLSSKFLQLLLCITSSHLVKLSYFARKSAGKPKNLLGFFLWFFGESETFRNFFENKILVTNKTKKLKNWMPKLLRQELNFFVYWVAFWRKSYIGVRYTGGWGDETAILKRAF